MRGRIAKAVLGLCLIVSALTMPEIGFHVPGYLADLFVGPVAYGAMGLTWVLMLLAGIGLVGAFRWAGFLAALAFVYNLNPLGSALSFLPLVPALVGVLGIRANSGLIIVHGTNLILLAGILGVQIAAVKPRSMDTETPTKLRLAAILARSLLSAVAVAVPLAFIGMFFVDQERLAGYIHTADNFTWLFLVAGVVLIGGVLGALAS